MNLPANWKKMLIGIVTAIAAFVEFDPTLFGKEPWLISLSKFIMIGGFAALGIVPSLPGKNGKNGNGATTTKEPPK